VASAPRLEIECFAPDAPSATPKHRWAGQIKGAAPGTSVTFGTQGRAYGSSVAPDGGSYMADLPAGTYDLAAADARAGTPHVVVLRGIEVKAPGATEVDFSKGALATKAREVAPSGNEANDDLTIFASFTTAAGAQLGFGSGRTIAVIDDKDLAPGDYQRVELATFSPTGDERGTSQPLSSADASPLAMTLPAPFKPEVKAATPAGLIVRPRATFAPYPGATFFQMIVSPGTPTPTTALTWIVNLDAAFGPNPASVELLDLTALPGYDAGFGPDPRLPTFVSTTVVESNLDFGTTLNGKKADITKGVFRDAKQLTTLPAMPR
jgi:hypothetical protein